MREMPARRHRPRQHWLAVGSGCRRKAPTLGWLLRKREFEVVFPLCLLTPQGHLPLWSRRERQSLSRACWCREGRAAPPWRCPWEYQKECQGQGRRYRLDQEPVTGWLALDLR